MPAQEVLNQLQSLGVSVEVRGDNLIIKPASMLPAELKGEIREHKTAILALLAAPPQYHDEATGSVLAWASQAAEAGLTLPAPVQFLEGPLRPRTTTEVGRFCRDQLKYLSLARSNKATGGWGRFTPEWWSELETSIIASLVAVKTAVDGMDSNPRLGLDDPIEK